MSLRHLCPTVGVIALLAHNEHQTQVEVGVGEVGIDDRADFVVELGETQVAFVEVEVTEVVV